MADVGETSTLDADGWDAIGPPDEAPPVDPADGRVGIAVFTVGLLAAIGGLSQPIGVADTLCAVVAAAGMVATRRLRNPQACALAAMSVLFAVWLSLRASPWLVPLDVLACVLLLAAAAGTARGISVLDVGPALATRAVGWLMRGVIGAASFLLSARSREREVGTKLTTVRPIALGLVLAAPVVLVVIVLLVSADVVFASLFDIGDVDAVVEGVFWFIAGVWTMATLLRIASTHHDVGERSARRTLHDATIATVLACLIAVYAAFAIAQVVALSGGADHVIRTEGLSYAEYARTGFFQLLAVALITWVVLAALSARTDRIGRLLRIFFEVAVLLTLMIVAVAVARLELYNDEFGLTMLRLYSEVFAVWIGAGFVLAGLRYSGLAAHRAWLTSVTAGCALLALFVLNVANPERIVVRHNVGRAVETGRFDAAYAAGLSADAMPALADGIDQLPSATRAAVRLHLCDAFYGAAYRPDASPGWAAANVARTRGRDAYRRICG